jgi:hypothetical protein
MKEQVTTRRFRTVKCDPLVWYLTGLAGQDVGASDRAMAAHDVALTADPPYAITAVNWAVLAYEQADPAGAADGVTAALVALGQDREVWCDHGVADTDLGRCRKELADVDRAPAMPGADHAEFGRQRHRRLVAAWRAGHLSVFTAKLS